MVFQQYALFPNLSAYENIAFALRVRRQPRPRSSAGSANCWPSSTSRRRPTATRTSSPAGCSSAWRWPRAGRGAAALLLLDEPLSALDAAIRDELRTELRRLQRQLDLTVIYVTHDQAEAMALSRPSW